MSSQRCLVGAGRTTRRRGRIDAGVHHDLRRALKQMEAGVAQSFERLRVHSIGLPQVLFQSITHMAPAAAVAYSIYISVPSSKQALALSVLLALIACL